MVDEVTIVPQALYSKASKSSLSLLNPRSTSGSFGWTQNTAVTVPVNVLTHKLISKFFKILDTSLCTKIKPAFMYDRLLTRLSDKESNPLSSVSTLESRSSTDQKQRYEKMLVRITRKPVSKKNEVTEKGRKLTLVMRWWWVVPDNWSKTGLVTMPILVIIIQVFARFLGRLAQQQHDFQRWMVKAKWLLQSA